MLEIIFEDNHQLVVNKPTGLLTQPGGTEQDSLEERAKQWIKVNHQKPGNVYLHAAHRLDKPVSGIVLFARTSKALSRLNASMRDKRSQKQYLAMVEGNLSNDQNWLEHFLIHGDHQAHVAQASHPNAVLARLHYRVLKRQDNRTLLEVTLDTGRYHQIRVQLAAIGHPILGDARYGGRIPYHNGAIALHHHRLQIPHPITDELQTFIAPTPSAWLML